MINDSKLDMPESGVFKPEDISSHFAAQNVNCSSKQSMQEQEVRTVELELTFRFCLQLLLQHPTVFGSVCRMILSIEK